MFGFQVDLIWCRILVLSCINANQILFIAHLNARSYFKFYTSQVQYELKATNQLKFEIELAGSVRMAQIEKIDHILALIKFEEVNRYEWIYLGSPRISQLFRLYVREKKLDSIMDFRTYTACRTADVIMIEPSSSDQQRDDATNMHEHLSAMNRSNQVNYSNGRAAEQHDCSHECVRFEDGVNLTKFVSFRRPILCGEFFFRSHIWNFFTFTIIIPGWERFGRSYRTPCKLNLDSYEDICDYLEETQSKLRIDCFDFSRDVDPSKSYGSNVVKNNVSYSLVLKSFDICFLTPLNIIIPGYFPRCWKNTDYGARQNDIERIVQLYYKS